MKVYTLILIVNDEMEHSVFTDKNEAMREFITKMLSGCDHLFNRFKKLNRTMDEAVENVINEVAESERAPSPRYLDSLRLIHEEENIFKEDMFDGRLDLKGEDVNFEFSLNDRLDRYEKVYIYLKTNELEVYF